MALELTRAKRASSKGAVAVAVGLTCACSPASDPKAVPGPSPAEPAPALAPTPEREPASCESPSDREPERLELGLNSAATAASGLEVHYVGSTQDHYEDGSFDVLAELRFTWGDEAATALSSALAPPSFRPALGHCWRLLEATDEGAIVELQMPRGPTLPSCAELEPPQLPVFDDFAKVTEGARFAATLRHDTELHEWRIEPQPRFVRHHATRVEWSNLAELGRRGLGQAVGADVQVVLRFESSEITASPERRMWMSEHVAHIESACVTPSTGEVP